MFSLSEVRIVVSIACVIIFGIHSSHENDPTRFVKEVSDLTLEETCFMCKKSAPTILWVESQELPLHKECFKIISAAGEPVFAFLNSQHPDKGKRWKNDHRRLMGMVETFADARGTSINDYLNVNGPHSLGQLFQVALKKLSAK